MEQMLVVAGFEIKAADTPAKMERLETLPQGKFVRHQRDGKVYYLYADPLFCKCLYKGTETEYFNFRRIARERKEDFKADLYTEQHEDLPRTFS